MCKSVLRTVHLPLKDAPSKAPDDSRAGKHARRKNHKPQDNLFFARHTEEVRRKKVDVSRPMAAPVKKQAASRPETSWNTLQLQTAVF